MTARQDSAWAGSLVRGHVDAFVGLANVERAPAMQAYMKGVAPFLGVMAPTRRAAQRALVRDAGEPPSVDAVLLAADALVARAEREYAYAAGDLVARYVKRLVPEHLVDPVQRWLLRTPWWDTVDLWVSGVVSPLCRARPAATAATIEAWSATDDQWLIRAAIGHQRGWRDATDVARVLAICGDHAGDRRFFVQKAIGWALRDLTPLAPAAVEAFVASHAELTRVAAREAERGLARLLAK